MRVIEYNNNQEIAIVLQDTGEIAKMLMAIMVYNGSPERKLSKIPVRVVELLEEALQKE